MDEFAGKTAVITGAGSGIDPFLVDDRVGWDAPGHVEAGARLISDWTSTAIASSA